LTSQHKAVILITVYINVLMLKYDYYFLLVQNVIIVKLMGIFNHDSYHNTNPITYLCIVELL